MSSYVDLVSDLDRDAAPDRRPSGLSLGVEAPEQEPLGLSEVQSYLHAPEEDVLLLETLVAGVREQVERRTRRLLVRREVTADWESAYSYVRLPFPPVASVSSVTDSGGSSVEYNRDGRTVDLADALGGEPLSVTYTAGFEPIPPSLKMQMLRDIASRYDHRSTMAVDETVTELPDVSAYDQWRVQ